MEQRGPDNLGGPLVVKFAHEIPASIVLLAVVAREGRERFLEGSGDRPLAAFSLGWFRPFLLFVEGLMEACVDGLEAGVGAVLGGFLVPEALVALAVVSEVRED